MKRLALTLLIASLLGLTGVASAGPAKSKAPADALEVMTQNQYLGADIAPLIARHRHRWLQRPPSSGARADLADNQPTVARVTRLAGQISGRQPHLVGLQEVWKFTCIPAVPELGADYPRVRTTRQSPGRFNDHLAITDGELGASTSKVADRAELHDRIVRCVSGHSVLPQRRAGLPAGHGPRRDPRSVPIVTAAPYAYSHCPTHARSRRGLTTCPWTAATTS